MLEPAQAQAIAEQYIRREMRESHRSTTDSSVQVESLEIDFKCVRLERLSYLVQAIASETLSRQLVITRKGLLSRLLRRRPRQVKSRNIAGNTVRFQVRIDADSGNILAADAASGRGGTIDPFFDMKRL